MEQLANEIRLGYTDKYINERLGLSLGRPDAPCSPFYTQGEEFFLELAEPYGVPSFPIHHDIRQPVPRADYANALRDWIDALLPVVPDFFSDLTYFFDPGEVLKPCFYHLYRIGEQYYLYLLRIDLTYRPMDSELVERGTNDTTSAYRSRRVYLESDLIPLASVLSELGKVVSFLIRQTISQTWIGETGKGYLVRGIWMDSELTKFFSKLFIPTGKRHYPFYPFTCRYKTVCMTVLNPGAEARRSALPSLHRVLTFLLPELETIQGALRSASFDEKMPLFADLKSRVPENLAELWTDLQVTPYLNANGQKEFRVAI